MRSPGVHTTTVSTSDSLLSTNPFLNSCEPYSKAAKADPVLSPTVSSSSDMEPSNELKPKAGILKRSEDSGGSHISLGMFIV